MPLPRRLEPRPAAHAGPAARGRARGRSRCSTACDAEVVVGFGGYVAVPAYLAARRRAHPDRGARGERPPGRRQPGRRPADHARVHRVAARRGCRTPRRSASRCGRRSPTSTGRRCAPRPGRAFGLRPRPARRCWSSAARRARRRSTGRCSAAAPALRAAGVQVLHIVGAEEHRRGRRPGPVPRRTSSCPTSIEMQYAYAAADFVAVPVGRDDLRRAHRGRAAGRLRAAAARRRRAARSTPSRSSRPAAGCWSTTPSCTPEWIADARSCRVLTDPRRLAAMSPRPRASGAARRRRRARPAVLDVAAEAGGPEGR